MPDTRLDIASVDEAKLIAGGLPYLHEVWHNGDWKLYEVIDSAPLARHAQVLSVDGNQLRLWVDHRARVKIQIRWSDHLAVLDGTQPVSAGVPCPRLPLQGRGPGDEWTVLHARTPGAYVLTSDFDVIPGRSHRGGVCRASGE